MFWGVLSVGCEALTAAKQPIEAGICQLIYLVVYSVIGWGLWERKTGD